MIQAGSMPRPVSTPLPMEDLQTLSDEIQSALSFASKLCFDEDENSPGKPLDREDMQVLYAKMLAVSSNWQQLVQKSEATKLFPITGHIDEESEVLSNNVDESKCERRSVKHRVMGLRPARPATQDDRLSLESRGAPPRSDSFIPEISEGISLGSVIYPQYKTSNVINKVINGVLSYLGNINVTSAIELKSNNPEDLDNRSMSDFSVGSKGSPPRRSEMSLDGVGTSMRSVTSSPSGRHRSSKSPSGRRHGKKPKQQGDTSQAKDKIIFARKGKQLPMTDDDEHAMTIFSATGVDKGVNTDDTGWQLKDIEAATSIDEVSAADNSIISQISFPESIPPKSKYVLDATYAHFPELGVPSSPYINKRNGAPDPRIVKALKESLNPLATLYNEYWQFIPSVFRSRLLSTAATRNEYVSSRDSLSFLFDAVLREVEKLELSLNVCSKGLEHSSKLTQSLIIAGEKKKLTEPYRKALSQLLVNIAEIEVSAVWSDIQLMEYRDMFHKFHHMGIQNLTKMIKECTSYRLSQQKFVACEHLAAGLLDRVAHIKSQWSSTLRVPPNCLFISEADMQMRLMNYEESIDALRVEKHNISSQLKKATDQLQLAAQEILEAQMEQDRTPNALLFYVTLLDPAILPSLHTIIDEMKHFKKFVTGELHFEYTAVRRGLEACTTVLPYVERFLSRFNDLKKKWTKDRIGKFTVMGLAGGDADATSVCPFCDSDIRMFDRK